MAKMSKGIVPGCTVAVGLRGAGGGLPSPRQAQLPRAALLSSPLELPAGDRSAS